MESDSLGEEAVAEPGFVCPDVAEPMAAGQTAFVMCESGPLQFNSSRTSLDIFKTVNFVNMNYPFALLCRAIK